MAGQRGTQPGGTQRLSADLPEAERDVPDARLLNGGAQLVDKPGRAQRSEEVIQQADPALNDTESDQVPDRSARSSSLKGFARVTGGSTMSLSKPGAVNARPP